MAHIAPLTPLRYDTLRLPRVVAPPYDVISDKAKEDLKHRDPHNVVRLILPDGEGDEKYATAARTLASFQEEGVLRRDTTPGLYRYEQTFLPPGARAGEERTRWGFLALVSLSPFSDRIVLPHERTLSGPKEDRLKLFRATRTNLSPGFVLYEDPSMQLNAPLAEASELATFSTEDGIRHRLSKVSNPEAIRAVAAFLRDKSLLIADGHHRYETALRYRDEVTAALPGAHPHGRHRYFMVFLANGASPDLLVFPTHRLIHGLGSTDVAAFRSRLAEFFDLTDFNVGAEAEELLLRLSEAGKSRTSIVCAFADGSATLLQRKGAHPVLLAEPLELQATDVCLLHSGVLEPLLGITKEAQAAKTNILYPQDARAALADLRAGKGQFLFLMNPTPVRDVRRVAEAGHVMPQKSTFFFPKVLTGLTIHTLEPDVEVTL